MLLAQTKNGEVLAIAGVVEGTDADKLRFRYQDKTRTISLKQVEGVIMASRPDRASRKSCGRRSRCPTRS